MLTSNLVRNMGKLSLIEEAKKCRYDAEDLKGTPDAAFAMRLAHCFEELSRNGLLQPSQPSDEQPVFSLRRDYKPHPRTTLLPLS